MYDPQAIEKQGTHNPTGDAEFEVFRTSDHPDLKLADGWYWDIPECRVDTPAHPRVNGAYAYANGPFPTSAAAYDHAMTNEGDAD